MVDSAFDPRGDDSGASADVSPSAPEARATTRPRVPTASTWPDPRPRRSARRGTRRARDARARAARRSRRGVERRATTSPGSARGTLAEEGPGEEKRRQTREPRWTRVRHRVEVIFVVAGGRSADPAARSSHRARGAERDGRGRLGGHERRRRGRLGEWKSDRALVEREWRVAGGRRAFVARRPGQRHASQAHLDRVGRGRGRRVGRRGRLAPRSRDRVPRSGAIRRSRRAALALAIPRLANHGVRRRRAQAIARSDPEARDRAGVPRGRGVRPPLRRRVRRREGRRPVRRRRDRRRRLRLRHRPPVVDDARARRRRVRTILGPGANHLRVILRARPFLARARQPRDATRARRRRSPRSPRRSPADRPSRARRRTRPRRARGRLHDRIRGGGRRARRARRARVRRRPPPPVDGRRRNAE